MQAQIKELHTAVTDLRSQKQDLQDQLKSGADKLRELQQKLRELQQKLKVYEGLHTAHEVSAVRRATRAEALATAHCTAKAV